jgi:hypothetical protein
MRMWNRILWSIIVVLSLLAGSRFLVELRYGTQPGWGLPLQMWCHVGSLVAMAVLSLLDWRHGRRNPRPKPDPGRTAGPEGPRDGQA